jgi:hypothetical protein
MATAESNVGEPSLDPVAAGDAAPPVESGSDPDRRIETGDPVPENEARGDAAGATRGEFVTAGEVPPASNPGASELSIANPAVVRRPVVTLIARLRGTNRGSDGRGEPPADAAEAEAVAAAGSEFAIAAVDAEGGGAIEPTSLRNSGEDRGDESSTEPGRMVGTSEELVGDTGGDGSKDPGTVGGGVDAADAAEGGGTAAPRRISNEDGARWSGEGDGAAEAAAEVGEAAAAAMAEEAVDASSVDGDRGGAAPPGGGTPARRILSISLLPAAVDTDEDDAVSIGDEESPPAGLAGASPPSAGGAEPPGGAFAIMSLSLSNEDDDAVEAIAQY